MKTKCIICKKKIDEGKIKYLSYKEFNTEIIFPVCPKCLNSPYENTPSTLTRLKLLLKFTIQYLLLLPIAIKQSYKSELEKLDKFTIN